jgi:hypothetical protein
MPGSSAEAKPQPVEPESAYGSRGSSADELELLIRRRPRNEIPENPNSNDGAHDVWIPAFLAALEQSPAWSVAARAAGVDHRTPARRAERDPEFAKLAAEAQERAVDLIEASAYKSAVYGDLEPIYQQGVRVGEVVRYSDKMREMLLRAKRPGQYGQKLAVDATIRGLRPTLTAEERRDLVLDLLPTLASYAEIARIAGAKPVREIASS